MTKPELDLRFVQVWNVPPDVAKKTLQWQLGVSMCPLPAFSQKRRRYLFIAELDRFQKKAGGADAEMAPIGAQVVTAAEPQHLLAVS